MVSMLESGKAALVSTVPRGRVEPPPLAEGLFAFEAALREARRIMPAWRRPETNDLWSRCLDAINESARMAERLRLEAPRLDYESMVFVIGDIIAPLEVFAEAERRVTA